MTLAVDTIGIFDALHASRETTGLICQLGLCEQLGGYHSCGEAVQTVDGAHGCIEMRTFNRTDEVDRYAPVLWLDSAVYVARRRPRARSCPTLAQRLRSWRAGSRN